MNYYNEFDPKAAAWLRELIKQGHLPAGDVDTRSITQVQYDDIKHYTQCHFFAGIGGWPLALRFAGWPEDKPVWTGSCPCQPFSCAGKGKADKDERHLWPEFKRLIEVGKPATVFGEQVASKLGREWLAGVFADLERMGYAAAGADLCAAGVGAPHIRQRLFWVGDANGAGRFPGKPAAAPDGHRGTAASDGSTGRLDDAEGARGRRTPGRDKESRRPVSSAHGLDNTVDGGRREGESPEVQVELGGRAPGSEQARELPNGAEGPGTVSAGGERVADADGAGDNEWASSREQPLYSEDARALLLAEGIVLCRDGKARRTQPGLCPLADGLPARMGRLRGYGNAIVPQVAAAFITSFIQTKF